jgi:hypothetical protein
MALLVGAFERSVSQKALGQESRSMAAVFRSLRSVVLYLLGFGDDCSRISGSWRRLPSRIKVLLGGLARSLGHPNGSRSCLLPLLPVGRPPLPLIRTSRTLDEKAVPTSLSPTLIARTLDKGAFMRLPFPFGRRQSRR